MLPPLIPTTKASNDMHFGAHSRSFGTCCPTLRVSRYHSRARLASGWLAGLYREGVEPSGSLRKVSGHMAILLSCSPDAMRSAPDCRTRRAFLHLSYSCASPFGPALLRDTGPEGDIAKNDRWNSHDAKPSLTKGIRHVGVIPGVAIEM